MATVSTNKAPDVSVTLPIRYPSWFGVGSNPPDRDYKAVAVVMPDRPHETLYYDFDSTEEAARRATMLRERFLGSDDYRAALSAWEDSD